jgi:2-methylcitrate dehydratase PrpD
MAMIEQLAEFIYNVDIKNISPRNIEKTELHIFDSLGAMLAGVVSDDTQASYDLVKRIDAGKGDKEILVPGFGFATSFLQAAYLAVVSARMTESDDIHLPSCTTPGSVVVPSALISAVFARADGKKMIEAVVAGYDIMTRLGAAVKGFEIVYRGIWPTYLCAAICAATIGSKIFDLTEEQIGNALAISLTLTTGLSGKVEQGLTSRWLTLGCAVQKGLTASLAAERGFAGDLAILDGPFSSVYGLEMDADLMLKDLSSKLRIEEVSLKPHCTARQALSPTEAFRKLIHEHQIEPESIEEILVTVPEQYRQMIDRPSFPDARVPSIVSVQYQMALAAFYEEDLYDLQRKLLRDEKKVRDFMKKVKVAASSDYSSIYPNKWPGKITLKSSGKTEEYETMAPLGDPGLPMNWNHVVKKIKGLTRGVLDASSVEKLETGVKSLKDLSSLDAFYEGIPSVCFAP